MDMWTDKSLTPYMAVTAHWIEATTVQTPAGPQYSLTLRADLIGFLRVPGHHDGEHLAQAFLYIIDRIGIGFKVCLNTFRLSSLTSRSSVGLHSIMHQIMTTL